MFDYFYANPNDDLRETPKICPLTNRTINESEEACLYCKCDDIDPKQWSLLYGRRYRCIAERKKIERWHEDQVKAAKTYKKLNNSLDAARMINIDDFFDYCDRLNREMYDNRQAYTKDMLINPYHDDGDKCLVYHFEDDNVVEINVVDNFFSHMATRFDRLRDKTVKSEISICAIPGYMAEAINVKLHLQHRMDVKTILHNDNPVYIKARGIAKYIDAVYGWSWLEFKKVRDRHLEMTEIVNYDNIIYIKQELDEIIRREYQQI